MNWDNTRTDILKVLSDTYERNKDYVKAIDTYEKYMNADTVNNQRVMDYYLLGQICYSYRAKLQIKRELMNMYLLKADTMFQVVVERSRRIIGDICGAPDTPQCVTLN